MRLLLALLALTLLATFAPVVAPPHAAPPASAWVAARAVALDPSWPGRTRLGALRFLGAWTLTSNDGRFGSISAMHVDGGQVLAFSDAGWMMRFAAPAVEGGRVAARIGALPDGPGSPDRKSARDVEAMWAEGGKAWIAFERINEVWRFDLRSWRAEAHTQPPILRDWPANRGPEAMARLADGRFILFDEGRGGGGPAALFSGDPAVPGSRALGLRYAAPAGYRPTDAARLPDGSLLVLNRHVSLREGVSAKLVRVRAISGGVLRGEEVADFRPPVRVDNMEALSVTREGGRTILWIASDDNNFPLQRTLLMKFEYAPS
ncbi:MAG TPA: esterase-like activity of phytase family protein [Allosphingosinicella sp.]|jgi:hypothetical protein